MLKSHPDTSGRHVPAGGVRGRNRAALPELLGLLASGAACTGPRLAQRMGISRAAVWKQVATWRAAGLAIDSGAAGYRLVHPLEPLDPRRIRAALTAAARAHVGLLENHWQLDSTSSELARRVDELRDRSFVFAEWQRAGRGRRGRGWLSPPATNLQFSCLKRFAGGFASLSGLSLAMGVAMAQALEDCGVRGIALKWPNDLVHDDAKLGGILIELGGDFMGPCHAIIGIGINVRVPASLRAVLDRPCTDLAELCEDRPPARHALAAAAISRAMAALDAFDAGGFAALAPGWSQRDALAGRTVRVDGGHGAFEGVVAGVDPRGALQVRCGGGLRSIDSAEVTVRPA